MGIVNSVEAIVAGDVVIPGMLPSRLRPRHNDAFVIIQLFPKGLSPHGGTLKIWNKSEKMIKQIWTREKIWIKWLAKRPRKNLDLLNLELCNACFCLKKHKHTKK